MRFSPYFESLGWIYQEPVLLSLRKFATDELMILHPTQYHVWMVLPVAQSVYHCLHGAMGHTSV